MNIWTHLLSFLATGGLIALLASDNLGLSEGTSEAIDRGPTAIDFAMNFIYLASTGLSFFFSALYHTFGCISEPVHSCLLKLDLSGIMLIQFGSYFPMVQSNVNLILPR
jgi:predicted membrane channel-forming protein YqfA (hemolysin III family)